MERTGRQRLVVSTALLAGPPFTTTLAINWGAVMRYLVLGLALLASCDATSGGASLFPYWAEWSTDDERGTVTIQLRADGGCSIYVADSRTESEARKICTYWVHGGRVRLRSRGERIGEGVGALEIEHLRDSDTLVILGETPRVLKRQPEYSAR